MKKKDRDNLKFIMGCSNEQFDEWMENATPDDIDYALEIIRLAKSELILEQMELEEVSETDEFTEAMAIINRIKNVGKI